MDYQDEYEAALCSCGSKEVKYPLHDIMGVFTGNVCSKCEEEHKSNFAPHVFNGTGEKYLEELYHHGERLELDY